MDVPNRRSKAAAWMRAHGLLPPASPKESLDERVEKALSDTHSFAGSELPAGVRAHVGVINLGNGRTRQTLRKQNVDVLRRWAEHNVWVRAAIDIYRQTVARAEWQLVPVDRDRRMNGRIEREIKKLLTHPNRAHKPYRMMKEEMIEDYLVLGHGALEFGINNDTTPWGIFTLDAADVAFIRDWDGTDATLPRYVQMARNGRPARALADEHVMCLVNRPRSYDPLGLSHVEILDMAVRSLLAADEKFTKQAERPITAGALNLGSGATKPQVDQVRNEMQQVEHPFLVIGGTEKMQFVPFNATAEEMRALEKCEWFVRQVAAIFQISTAKLRLAVDTSRANTEAMFDDDLEGPGALLERIAEIENWSIVARWGEQERTNIKIDYPIMNRKSEKEQSEIGRTALNSMPWRSINEVRRATGDAEIDHPLANEILIDHGGQLITLTMLEEKLKEPPTPPPGTQPTDPKADDPNAPPQAKDEEAKQTEKGAPDAARALDALASLAPELAALIAAPQNPHLSARRHLP